MQKNARGMHGECIRECTRKNTRGNHSVTDKEIHWVAHSKCKGYERENRPPRSGVLRTATTHYGTHIKCLGTFGGIIVILKHNQLFLNHGGKLSIAWTYAGRYGRRKRSNSTKNVMHYWKSTSKRGNARCDGQAQQNTQQKHGECGGELARKPVRVTQKRIADRIALGWTHGKRRKGTRGQERIERTRKSRRGWDIGNATRRELTENR